jgi:branched-chain amino acid transport system permease protein
MDRSRREGAGWPMIDTTVLTQLLNGIILGLIYGLMAIGLTMIWSITDLPDFSQGGIYIISAYVAYWSIVLLNIPYFFAIPTGAVMGILLSVFFERIVYKPLRASGLSCLLAAIALFFLLENVAIALWTPKAKIMSVPETEVSLNLFGIVTTYHRIIILIISVLLFILVHLFIKYTKMGMAIRAVSEDKEIAGLMGINTDKIYVVTWALGGALTSVAAILISPLYAVWPGMGDLPLLKALVVVILGGFGSIIGALIGGLILGVIETFGAVYVSAAYQHGFAFIILLLTLSLRPRGLFGKR